MEQQNTPAISVLTTIITTILGWITLLDAQYFLSFILTCIGIISGMFAIRYYYHAGNAAKKSKSNKHGK